MRNQGSTYQGAEAGDRRVSTYKPLSAPLRGNLLCVDEHMLLEVLPPHEQLVTVITLEILLACVDDHVGLQVSLLGKRLVTQSTTVVLLTCTL